MQFWWNDRTGSTISSGTEDVRMADARRRTTSVVYRWARIWLVLLALLCAATWAYEVWSAPSGMALRVPLGPGRQLHANLWKPGPGYADADFNRGMLITRRGPPTIMLWYHNSSAGRMTQLGSIRLALWPIAIPTAALAGLVLWLRTRQSRG
jgi:hypothetical protein